MGFTFRVCRVSLEYLNLLYIYENMSKTDVIKYMFISQVNVGSGELTANPDIEQLFKFCEPGEKLDL